MDFQQLSESDILSIANPLMDNLMEGSTRIDHGQHTRDFTDRLKSIVTREYLERVCKNYQAEKGYFTEREVVAVFKRPASAAIIWKQSFTKAQGDFVAEMLLVKEGEEYLVDHVMVF